MMYHRKRKASTSQNTLLCYSTRTILIDEHSNYFAMEKSGDGRDPSGFLSEIIGAPVTVKLNSGIVYKGWSWPVSHEIHISDQYLGELQSVDGYMNIALEKAQEFVDGSLHRSYGDAFIRGNNGLF
jgi:U6 snRNA-associated Sm-like protein LSm6